MNYDLFNQNIDESRNWLPKDGIVNYYGHILTKEETDFFYKKLLDSIEWRNDEAVVFGKKNYHKA